MRNEGACSFIYANADRSFNGAVVINLNAGLKKKQIVQQIYFAVFVLSLQPMGHLLPVLYRSVLSTGQGLQLITESAELGGVAQGCTREGGVAQGCTREGGVAR